MEHYSRKQRKELAKMLGLINANETPLQRAERLKRSAEAGKQIHTQFVMNTENSIRNQMTEIEAKRFNSLVESLGEERAKQAMENERIIKQKKQAKKLKKLNK